MNCLKNGKGREYYDSEDLKYNVDIYKKYGKLKCEGELNGKRNGKFKNYSAYGGLDNECEYLNWKKMEKK